MKVKLLDTGESAIFNDEYAARLIEQGKAEVIAEKKPAAKAEEPEPAKETEPAKGTGKKK